MFYVHCHRVDCRKNYYLRRMHFEYKYYGLTKYVDQMTIFPTRTMARIAIKKIRTQNILSYASEKLQTKIVKL